MIRKVISLCALTGLLAGCVSTTPKTLEISQLEKTLKPPAGVDRKANAVLFQASEFLKSAKTFKFQAEITRDVILYDGVREQFGGVSKVTIERPNKLRAIFDGDERSRRSFFDGETLSMYSIDRKIYAQKKIPGTIDNAIDFVFETFGFSVPLADLAYANPYTILIKNVDKGYFMGKHKIDGVICNHLAFQQELIDWQIWIEDSDTPWVHKLIITYKTEDGSPEYEAEISNWEFNPSVSESDFKFTPPEGIEKIEFIPVDDIDGPNEIIEEVDNEEEK